MDRRSFFRQLFHEGLKGAAKATDHAGQRYRVFEQFLEQDPSAPKQEQSTANGAPRVQMPVMRFLRPPGALDEADFANKCAGCGACVKACPTSAIQLFPEQAGGRPYIVPRLRPCTMCEEVACTHACPSGALLPLERPADIRIGLAKVDVTRCLRTPAQTVSRGGPIEGEDCRVCVTQCPVGPSALKINDQGQVEVGSACTGCGICEQVCPTEPASIFIIPKAAMKPTG